MATTHPASEMMGHGYEPESAEGALKIPIFQTSTFVFDTAEQGKAFFELADGLRDPEPGERLGMIYSRLDNPDLTVLEARLALWDRAEAAVSFASGMAAIGTTLLAYLRPGDALAVSRPLYGGTDHLATKMLPEFGIDVVDFPAGATEAEINAALRPVGGRLRMMLIETPANPTNRLVDIEACARMARRHGPALLAVDNTFLGPVFQRPLSHGADLVLYSATKFIGGHSDLVAGACLGAEDAIGPIRTMRTFLGTMPGPWTAWLLMRSLETLELRMERQAGNAQRLARFLAAHSKVGDVHYLDMLPPNHPDYETYKRQCLSPGSMIAFEIPGGEPAAFRFLNALRLVKLAVSLGSTESLAEHPASMTHADVPAGERERFGVGPGLVRISVGVEHYDDLLADVSRALEEV